MEERFSINMVKPKTIRGKVIPGGFEIATGTMSRDFTADDLNKALQLGEIQVKKPEKKITRKGAAESENK